MAVFNKFNSWAEVMVEAANLGSDSFVIALTNSAPSAGNSILTDITQISYTNLSARTLTTASSSQTGGVYSLVFNDLVLTASGAVASFRYVVIYDDTVANGPLVGWYDYGSAVSMTNGETFTIDFGANALTVT